MDHDLQPGDRVRITVCGRINEIREDLKRIFIDLDGQRSWTPFDLSEAIKVERLTFRVGDRVQTPKAGLVRTILAIHEDFAWLDNGGATGGPQTYQVDQLRMVP